MELFFFALAFGTVTVACFLAGLARARFTPAPVIATAVIIGSYIVLVASVWIWASRCWDCGIESGSDDSRSFLLYVAIVYPGVLAVFDVLLMWLGAFVSTLVWRWQPPVDWRAVATTSASLVFAVFILFGLAYY